MSIKALRQYIEMLHQSGITEIHTSEHVGEVVTSTEVCHDKAELLQSLAQKYADCIKCPLHHNRQKLVYGSGNPYAKVMIIGEAPGDQENQTGLPFVGRAGELLTKMLAAIDINREDVYIANIVKCRPPSNRNPEAEERLACLPYLVEQIQIIKPRIFLLMGLVAAQTLLNTKDSMGDLRLGNHILFDLPAYVTYHPAALLRNENWKRPAWEDLKRFAAHLKSI